MCKRELILLDADLENMISNSVFHAVLKNGHTLVAYVPRGDAGTATFLRVGDRVRVEMSPYDMSRGRIVEKLEMVG